mmetsp:Transcript_25529/g.37093  ORF Transcript_25529/g.37093 Transcript_25529/m.37093 type:complete len:92 (+) Transcript_25529:249-524(+)
MYVSIISRNPTWRFPLFRQNQSQYANRNGIQVHVTEVTHLSLWFASSKAQNYHAQCRNSRSAPYNRDCYSGKRQLANYFKSMMQFIYIGET